MSTAPLLPGDAEPLLSRQDSGSARSPPWLSLLTRYQWVVWVGVPAVVGLALGLALGTSAALPSPWDVVSPVIGWTYFAAWSISFYPQVWLNYSRKSVAGLSLDFQLLNLLGFTAYAVYNCALYWSPVVRAQYRASHAGTDPAVHANDVFFALHALVLTAVTLAQCAAYPTGRTPPARWCVLAVAGTTTAVLGYAGLLAIAAPALHPSCVENCPVTGPYTWLDLLYAISSVKLAVSLVKYIPQVRAGRAGAEEEACRAPLSGLIGALAGERKGGSGAPLDQAAPPPLLRLPVTSIRPAPTRADARSHPPPTNRAAAAEPEAEVDAWLECVECIAGF